MSINYIWVCDERKQYIDPYPLDCPHVYVWLQVFMDDDGKRGWSGCNVRLINDSGDQNEYYLRKSTTELDANAWDGTMADTYEDVTDRAKRVALKWFEEHWWVRK